MLAVRDAIYPGGGHAGGAKVLDRSHRIASVTCGINDTDAGMRAVNNGVVHGNRW